MKQKLSDLPDVFRRAAYLVQANGHHQGDYVLDAFSRVLTTPLESRPMSVAAALWCAADPAGRMVESELASAAIRYLAGRLLVDGEGPRGRRTVDCAIHLAAWEEIPGRSLSEVIGVLLDTALAASGRTVLVPSDGQIVLGRDREQVAA